MSQFSQFSSWIKLQNYADTLRSTAFKNIRSTDDKNDQLIISSSNIQLNLSSQLIDKTAIDLLIDLANERNLQDEINALINGSKVNLSESKPALHTALRHMDDKPIIVDGHNIIPQVLSTRDKMREISDKIRSGCWLGYSGKPITDIVNIGLGGSDLGPRFCINALADYAADHLNYYFISDIDPNAFERVTRKLNPETTLFIISSKSFTTVETLYNAKKAMAFYESTSFAAKHFIAVTANVNKAFEFGIDLVLPIWDWVGGRYSVCSAINLITAIAIGYDNFHQILLGANSMDKHFQEADFSVNLPVLLALIAVWNNNFLNIHNLLILVYAQQLEGLIPYVQQLDMESNGKSINNQGQAVNYATGQMIWGGMGNQAQHSYYQLLCQGTHQVSFDLLTLNSFANEPIQEMFESNKRVLTHGVLHPTDLSAFIPGNRPVNHIRLDDCSPFSIGQLIALYEHKVYVQAVIWDINPFDQPGVESAKRQGLVSIGDLSLELV